MSTMLVPTTKRDVAARMASGRAKSSGGLPPIHTEPKPSDSSSTAAEAISLGSIGQSRLETHTP